MTDNIKPFDFITEFSDALTIQLEDDDKRWGNSWLDYPREGQEERIGDRISQYFSQYKNAGVPVPWLKIAGYAMIAWVRENHPELFEK